MQAIQPSRRAAFSRAAPQQRQCSRKAFVCRAARGEGAVNAAAKQAGCMLLSAATALALTAGSCQAVGLESVELPSINAPDFLSSMSEAQEKKLQAADEAFESSDTLKMLLQKSEANRSKNKTEIQNKYCYR